MLYLAIGINIFPKYHFQGKKFTVISLFPKHSFLLIKGGKKIIQISFKTNIPNLARPNSKFYLLMLLKLLIWKIRVTNRKDLFSGKVP